MHAGKHPMLECDCDTFVFGPPLAEVVENAWTEHLLEILIWLLAAA